MKARVAEERLAHEEFAKDAYIGEVVELAVEQAMAKFKQSDEFATFLTIERDAGYDLGVKEIFFNIWSKCRNVDYRFLGAAFVNIMEEWIEEER